MIWTAITCSITMFAYLIANLIPFFNALTGIIGALLLSNIAFVMPAGFYLYCERKEMGVQRVSATERCLLWFCVGFGVFMMVLGTTAELIYVVGETETKAPFSC